ncbi:hypothetical protein GXM_01330 [Nostoc sphaeroides CCNUC1]|uniref:Uncharacterized protein n=1 Tax=Nostoc sphaeroides CCNUC1 TaxID=2653204 RepID=A0A5P8VTZ8_9NOSO|nr:hypothetical protein GXM_01330 [Nostoc sphaeroides CCNUC1]
MLKYAPILIRYKFSSYAEKCKSRGVSQYCVTFASFGHYSTSGSYEVHPKS